MKSTPLLLITLFTFALLACTDKKFNAGQWKNWNDKSGESSLRWDMCDDLIDNYLSIGMPKEKVIEILGPPMTDCEKPDCDLIYSLGPCRSGISYGSLYLTLKDNKIVEIFKHCG